MNSAAPSDIVIEIAYLIATALFILSLKWMSSPTTARRGVFAGEAGMVLAIAGTLLHHGIVDYKWIVDCAGARNGDRHSAWPRADDRCSAANGAEPRFRRALRHAGRYCGILSCARRMCRNS